MGSLLALPLVLVSVLATFVPTASALPPVGTILLPGALTANLSTYNLLSSCSGDICTIKQPLRSGPGPYPDEWPRYRVGGTRANTAVTVELRRLDNNALIRSTSIGKPTTATSTVGTYSYTWSSGIFACSGPADSYFVTVDTLGRRTAPLRVTTFTQCPVFP